MALKSTSTTLIIAIVLSGCSAYRNYPFNYYYESQDPGRTIWFNMKDSEIHTVNTDDIALVKNTEDYYTIYFKNSQLLVLQKDQIENVRMVDKEKLDGINTGIAIFGIIIFVGLIALLVTGG